VTTNAIILCAYAIGNAVGPFMWLKRYQPRNHTPWAVISSCAFVSAILILTLRLMLAVENKKRNVELYDDTYDNVYIVETDSDGMATEKKVDKVYGFGVDGDCSTLILMPIICRHSWTSPISKIGNFDMCSSFRCMRYASVLHSSSINYTSTISCTANSMCHINAPTLTGFRTAADVPSV
jgi:hypothetical protein